MKDKKPYLDTLIPNNYLKVEQALEEEHNYRKLNELSKFNYKETHTTPAKMGKSKHNAYFKSLDERGLNEINEILSNNIELHNTPQLQSILESIITPEIDSEIKAYFGSYYAISSCDKRTLTSDSRNSNPSIKWHCDVAPLKSVMLMCYLNNDSEHDSSTLFLSTQTTNKLKDVGYIYTNVIDRHEHIDGLLDYYELDSAIERHSFIAGESVVFSASNIAHRAEVPRPETQRSTIDISIIPSPIPWREAFKKGFRPNDSDGGYFGEVERLLSAVDISTIDSIECNVIKLSQSGDINGVNSLNFHLKSIFKDQKYSQSIFIQMQKMNINFETLTISELLSYLKKKFRDGIKWDASLSISDLDNFNDLLSYEKKFTQSMIIYSPSFKPDRAEYMWPIPNHKDKPKCKFGMLPYVNQHKIMNKDTPIGSAGSCFAVEIAEVLQNEEFNYVVTEFGDNPDKEAIIDGYEVASGKAMYSANFGILFNTPSLLQLAQKGFGEKEFTKFLFKDDNGLYMDPYRENVFFLSEENYLRDYPKHINAIKQTLLQSEVFIFTAGLNECWQLLDGTVMSRNPRRGFHHLIEHKVLTVQENIDNIINFFNIVKRHNPKFKLVLTLSPVPLLATGLGNTHHILEANTHSKAVLKVALEEVVKQHTDIYYLPSYELVTETIENPWKEDHRHVTPETVSRVITMFKEIFVSE
mgnify:CR=1 FL=1